MLYRKYLLYFLVLVYISGTIGFIVKPDFFSAFTPYTLLLTSFVFLCFQPIYSAAYWIAFLCIALIGFISEVIGVKTGLVFGSYSYGSVLGLKLFDVPLIISINWSLLACCSVLTATYFFKTRLAVSIAAAVLATLTDLLMEQVAPLLDFWYFEGGKAGIHNYMGWLLISFIAAFLFEPQLSGGNKKVGVLILFLQVFFFGLIYLLNL